MQCRLWLNGIEQEQILGTTPLSRCPFRGYSVVGYFPAGDVYYFNGYIADVHAIQGQLLDPTTFGRYNINGVWVPADPAAAIAAAGGYGANGFYLDFADPNDIGKDTAPIDANHPTANNFTATGFDTVPPVTPQWQDRVTTWIPYSSTSAPPSVIFDGDSSTQYPAGPGTMDFLPLLEPFDEVTSFETFGTPRLGTVTLTVNGVVVDTNTGNANQVLQYNGTGPITQLDYTGTDVYSSIIYIKVNGQELLNGGGPDYDLMQDSPTQNFATLNPIYIGPAQTGPSPGHH